VIQEIGCQQGNEVFSKKNALMRAAKGGVFEDEMRRPSGAWTAVFETGLGFDGV